MHTLFRAIKITAVVCWLTIIWGIRGLTEDPMVVWVLGFAPDFFAAVALYFDAVDRTAKARGLEAISGFSYWLLVAVGVCVLLFIGELLQEYVFWGNFDWHDVVAHFVGATLSVVIMALVFPRELQHLESNELQS